MYVLKLTNLVTSINAIQVSNFAKLNYEISAYNLFHTSLNYITESWTWDIKYLLEFTFSPMQWSSKKIH